MRHTRAAALTTIPTVGDACTRWTSTWEASTLPLWSERQPSCRRRRTSYGTERLLPERISGRHGPTQGPTRTRPTCTYRCGIRCSVVGLSALGLVSAGAGSTHRRHSAPARGLSALDGDPGQSSGPQVGALAQGRPRDPHGPTQSQSKSRSLRTVQKAAPHASVNPPSLISFEQSTFAFPLVRGVALPYVRVKSW